MGSPHELPLDTPIIYLKCEEAFSGLTDKERHYVHHLSRASWWGGLIVFCQTSPESPLIFSLLSRLMRSQSVNSLKEVALDKAGFSEDDFKGLLIYYSGLLYNLGNYVGFGDRKFVPTVAKEKFDSLVRGSKSYLEAPDVMQTLLDKAGPLMYSLDENVKYLGLPPNGVTMYFTPNCTKDDAELAKKYMCARNIEAWNTRVLKYELNGVPIIDIRHASIDSSPLEGFTVEEDMFEDVKFRISRGDYSDILKKVVFELELAKGYASTELESKMLNKYIESFTMGAVKAHKDGSTFWVQNKSPAVETYLGFIEVYRDPTNQRAEYESFVAVVNREQSRKFDTLVSRAETEFLHLLPWGNDFEEDVFQQPDYSSLDVVTFASSGLPIGINIPNYKDIKEEEGFKNVSLSNVMASRSVIKGGPFLSEADHELREKFGTISLEIQVGLHELLGHGCGKFLRVKEDGSLNFDPEKIINPFTGGPVSYYKKGENFQSRFGAISSAYEECRAELVAIYLNLVDSILDIFEISPDDRKNVKYVGWLDMMYAGLRGLEMYQPSQKKWGQAHSQARYVILRVAIEAGDNFVDIRETVGDDGLPDLLLSVDCAKIETVGREAIGNFLRKMQVYRSMGDEEGIKMFESYSVVPDDGPYPFAKWHEIVVRKKRPRMILTMPNTKISGDAVELVSYADGVEGKISSYLDRFSGHEYEEIEKMFLSFTNCGS